MKMVVAHALRHFEMKPVAGYQPQLTLHFMKPKHPIQIRICKLQKEEEENEEDEEETSFVGVQEEEIK